MMSIINRARVGRFNLLCATQCARPKTSQVDSATEVTHTGQVNRQFAEKLIAEVPPISCKEHIVACDGGGGALGHPKVFINLDQPGAHSCGYCGLRFVLENHTEH